VFLCYQQSVVTYLMPVDTMCAPQLRPLVAPKAGSLFHMPPIRIFVTGGTFDKEYNELTGELYFQKTHIHDMLRLGRCRLDLAVETLMMVDSLQMTDADRHLILERCTAAQETRLVITHGTDTMEQTAAVLGPQLTGKTVVLTGAMVPYTFGSSDGMFNLGTSLAFVQSLPPGVYVVMNGRCFQWDAVRKNRQLGVFESLMES
jgi:L-asparaginase